MILKLRRIFFISLIALPIFSSEQSTQNEQVNIHEIDLKTLRTMLENQMKDNKTEIMAVLQQFSQEKIISHPTFYPANEPRQSERRPETTEEKKQ